MTPCLPHGTGRVNRFSYVSGTEADNRDGRQNRGGLLQRALAALWQNATEPLDWRDVNSWPGRIADRDACDLVAQTPAAFRQRIRPASGVQPYVILR